MNRAELDRLWQRPARKIVSAEITSGPGLLPSGLYDQAPRVMATCDDGSRLERLLLTITSRSFAAKDFIGLTVDEARALKFDPGHSRPLAPNAPTV
jgi:hypothetical protein